MLDTIWAGADGPLNLKLLACNASIISMIETAQNTVDRDLNREELDSAAFRS